MILHLHPPMRWDVGKELDDRPNERREKTGSSPDRIEKKIYERREERKRGK